MYLPTELPVVGREVELDAFQHALADAELRGMTILVTGTVGMGKSALLRKFRDFCEGHDTLDITCPPPFRLGVADDVQTFLERLLYETFRLARTSDGRSRWAGPDSRAQLAALLSVVGAGKLFDALTEKPGPPSWTDLLDLFRQLSEQMDATRRFVFLIDPEKYMRPESGGAWLPVLMQLPPKFVFVFAQRPDGRLATQPDLAGGHVRRIPESLLGSLSPDATQQMIRFGLEGFEGDDAAAVVALNRYEGWPVAITEALWLLRTGVAPADLPDDPAKLSGEILRACERHPSGTQALKLLRALVILEVPVPLTILSTVLDQDLVDVRRLTQTPPVVGLVVERERHYGLFHNVLAEAVRQRIEEDEQWRPLHRSAAAALERRITAGQPDEFALNRLPYHVRTADGDDAYADAVFRFADTRHQLGHERALAEDLITVADAALFHKDPAWLSPPFHAGVRAMAWAILRVSVCSIASRMPSALFAEAVRRRMWSTPEALDTAGRIPSGLRRLTALARIAANAPDNPATRGIVEAVKVARSLGEHDFSDVTEDLQEIAVLVARDNHEDAMSLARDVTDLDARISVLARVADTMAPEDREGVVHEIMSLACGANSFFLASRCAPILAFLTRSQFDAISSYVEGIENDFLRSQMQAALVQPCADLNGVNDALHMASSIAVDTEQAAGLASLLPRLDEIERPAVIERILATLERTDEDMWRTAYCEAADQYLESVAVFLHLSISAEAWRPNVIENLASFLNAEELERVVHIVLPDVSGEDLYLTDLAFQARALQLLTSHLTAAQSDYHFNRLMNAMTDERFGGRENILNRGLNWLYMAARQPEDRERLRRWGLDAVGTIDTKTLVKFLEAARDDIEPSEAWSLITAQSVVGRSDEESITNVLIRKLDTAHLEDLIASTRRIGDEAARIRAFAMYARYSGDGYCETAMNKITGLKSGNEPWEQARILSALLPDAPPLMVKLARDWIEQLDNHGALAEYLLPAVAARVSGDEKTRVIDAAIDHALQIEDYCRMGWALTNIVPHCDPTQWERVAERVLALPLPDDSDRQWRAHAACSILSEGDGTPGAELVDEVLRTVEDLTESAGIETLLTWAVPFMNAEQLERAQGLALRDSMTAFDSLTCRFAIAARWGADDRMERLAQAVADAYPFSEGRGLFSPEDAEGRMAMQFTRNVPTNAPSELRTSLIGSISSSRFRRQAIQSVVERTTKPPLSNDLFDTLWELCTDIEDAADLATALTAVALAAPRDRRLHSLQTAWRAALESGYDDPVKPAGRGQNLPALAQALAEPGNSSDALREIWLESMPTMMSRPREDFLVDLGASAPLVLAMGGEESTRCVCDAIDAVGRWLP